MPPNLDRIGPDQEPKRVLVVEDEQVVCNFMKRVLAGEGYDVLCAANGEEALGFLNAAAFDLVVTDIMMPMMGGIELGTRISRLPLAPPVIYASASDHPPAGMGGWYLQKPFRAGDLARMAREILSGGGYAGYGG